jgi:hypothetical protein
MEWQFERHRRHCILKGLVLKAIGAVTTSGEKVPVTTLTSPSGREDRTGLKGLSDLAAGEMRLVRTAPLKASAGKRH